MRIKYFIIALALLLSLFVYLFFRTEQTVVNYLFIKIWGGQPFYQSRAWVTSHVNLSNFQTYSLPEALWILAITLLSKRYMIQFGKIQISLWYLPLLLAFGFEFFQWMHWSNGSADLNDLWGAGLFWALGMTVFPEKEPKISLFQSFNIHALLCTGAYAVVYLAHVMN